MERDWRVRQTADVFRGLGVSRIERVRLGSARQIGDALRENNVALRQADEVTCLICGDGLDQCLRIGESNVFGRKTDQTARDVQRVFSGLEHARQPIHARVGV